MLIGSGIHAFLSRSLVGSDADLFVHFRSRVPQDQLVSDVSADGIAFAVKERDAISVRRVEPIIRLAEHHRREKLHAGHCGEGVFITITGTNWACAHCTHWRIEHAM